MLSYTAVGLCVCVTEERNILNNECPFAILLQGITALHGKVISK